MLCAVFLHPLQNDTLPVRENILILVCIVPITKRYFAVFETSKKKARLRILILSAMAKRE